MIKKYSVFAIIALLSINIAVAQKYKDFSFSEEPDFDLTEAKKAEDESILKKTYSTEYVLETGGIFQYVFNHTVSWINSDEAIEKNNKIYLASRESTEYLYQNARVIKPSGEIINLKEEDIKEGVYENETKYYYYAIEGLEKGSIIETSTYQKKRPYYYGSIVYLQEEIRRYNTLFELICPEYLVFAFKSLNGAPEIEKDTVIEEANRWFIEQDSTIKILDQPNVYKLAIRESVVYKLDRNNYSNVADITSYGTVSQNIYTNLHPELSKSTIKKLDKILKETGASDITDLEEKIRAIENYVKVNYQIIESNYEQLDNIEFILENKAANDNGCALLLMSLFNMADISHEVVVTCDRSQLKFDPEFEAYLFLNKYLLYLPKVKKYIDPSSNFNRLGVVPSMLTNTYGLFIKEVSLGDMKAAVGKIKFIEPTTYKDNVDKMNIDVDFSEDPLTPKINIQRELTGYSAMYFQPFFHLMDEEETEDMEKALVEMVDESIKAEEIKLTNIGENDFGVKPFIYEFTTNEHPFIEKAGNDILFKIGEVIGPQVEMYQEEERQFDVEDDHNRSYYRKITFNVPEGYSLKNLEILNFEFKYGEEGSENLFFESKCVKKGDGYELECYEYYADINFAKEDFEKYRTVVNAAADFNKLVLIFEKL